MHYEFDTVFTKIVSQLSENKHPCMANDISNINHRLVLYGAGGNCEFALWYYTKIFNFEVSCLCDSKATGNFEYNNISYDIITPKQLIENYTDAFVLITTWNFEKEIKDFLIELGFPSDQVYYFRHRPQSLDSFMEKHYEGYKWAYNFFKDANSKRLVIDRIKLFLYGTAILPDSPWNSGYFACPYVTLNDNEVFIDADGYTGDTVMDFLQKVKKYSHVYSFEPDPRNYNQLLGNVSECNNITVVKSGLWSESTELRFCVNNDSASSAISTQPGPEQNIDIPVISLDKFFERKPKKEYPTLIKMDIEGSEKEALIGGTQVINMNKPKLIICAYHKTEDIYELAKTLTNIRGDYDVKLWKIGHSFWDMVMYAV